MRQGSAFRFIPELLGDVGHGSSLINDPKRLSFETAIEILNMAGNVFKAITEHKNTRELREAAGILEEEFKDYRADVAANYEEKRIQSIITISKQLEEKSKNANELTELYFQGIEILKNEFERIISTINRLKPSIDDNYKEYDQLNELQRQIQKEYIRLLTNTIKED